jgi:hypothetical protein
MLVARQPFERLVGEVFDEQDQRVGRLVPRFEQPPNSTAATPIVDVGVEALWVHAPSPPLAMGRPGCEKATESADSFRPTPIESS